MKRTLRIRRKAKREYVGAIDYYDGRQADLGLRFSQAVEAVLDDLTDGPDRWPEIEPGVRQAPVPSWPYTVVYQSDRRSVGVVAIFHTSRDPQEWRDRI